MWKSRSLLGAIAALAMASASLAFAAPPPSAETPPGARADVVKVAKADVNPIALTAAAAAPAATKADIHPIFLRGSDIDPIFLTVAASGTGADSAYQAWVKSLQSASEHRSRHEMRLQPETRSNGGGSACDVARGPYDVEDDGADASVRRLLT